MAQQRNIQTLLVTGGAGFIGSAFIRYLLSPQAAFEGKCINLDALTYAGNLENLASIADDPRYAFEYGNICQPLVLERLFAEYAIDAIIHFAAESHVDRSIADPERFMETNVLGTFHLLEAVRRHPNVHFHHVSTDEVYGSLGETGRFTEETPYHPNSPYSASKAASDHLVCAYGHTYELSYCISNCSNNYGPYHFPEKFIPLMILNGLERRLLPIYGAGRNIRDWLYVEDHARALYLLLHQGRRGETYNIGGGAEQRNIDLAHTLIRLLSELQGVPLQQLESLIAFVQDRPGHDWRYAIDDSKIRRELGWSPAYTLDEGLRKTVLWYMEHLEWVSRVQTGAYRAWMEHHYAERKGITSRS